MGNSGSKGSAKQKSCRSHLCDSTALLTMVIPGSFKVQLLDINKDKIPPGEPKVIDHLNIVLDTHRNSQRFVLTQKITPFSDPTLDKSYQRAVFRFQTSGGHSCQ